MTADSIRVWRSLEARRVSAYHSHRETCEVCTDEKHCEEGYALAAALADPVGREDVPGRDVNQLRILK